MREFQRVDAAIAPVLDMNDIFQDAHFRARQIITEVGGVAMQNVVARFRKRRARCVTRDARSTRIPTKLSLLSVAPMPIAGTLPGRADPVLEGGRSLTPVAPE